MNETKTPIEEETVYLAGGCFWCIEAPFKRVRGIFELTSGYMGGSVENPSYRQICSGLSGHAEVVKVTFNPSIITFLELLAMYFTIHDPTTLNRQGNDQGSQYRSAIFYNNLEQKQQAEQYIGNLNQQGIWPNKIVTTLEPVQRFYPAEAHHQDYFDRNRSQPYCQIIIAPKLEKLKQAFPKRLR